MRPSVSIAFLYSLIVTGIAFVEGSWPALSILALLNLSLSLAYGGKRFGYILLLLAIGLIGVFINALAFSNEGPVVATIGSLEIRENALRGFASVSMRLLLIAGAGGVFFFSRPLIEIMRGLKYELGLPLTISFPLFYAVRMLPSIKSDLDEITHIRRMRRRRTLVFYPPHLIAVTATLLSINLEKAIWSGIAAELRGYRSVKRRPRGVRLLPQDYALIALLAVQVAVSAIL